MLFTITPDLSVGVQKAKGGRNVYLFHFLYPISANEWWSMFNNAGYKSLLDQLAGRQLTQFKRERPAEIEVVAVGGAIGLNADVRFGVVRL